MLIILETGSARREKDRNEMAKLLETNPVEVGRNP
jgi:hypothetical protein